MRGADACHGAEFIGLVEFSECWSAVLLGGLRGKIGNFWGMGKGGRELIRSEPPYSPENIRSLPSQSVPYFCI